MLLPPTPLLTRIERITPSIYEASLACQAKAAWYAGNRRGMLPDHPAAVLGTAFHTVAATANRGQLGAGDNAVRNLARTLFDESAQKLYEDAHPLLRLKFPALNRLPYYNLQRERAARLAVDIAEGAAGVPHVRATTDFGPKSTQSETWLCSSDGLIAGRPDRLERRSKEVVDYKSGYVREENSSTVADSEARQLRLYAYLATQNEIPISVGAIIRSDGQRCELPITPEAAAAEAEMARCQLRALNEAISAGASFGELTSPSPSSCRACPCIPLCSPFWSAVRPEWSSECGTHVDGLVVGAEARSIHGASVATVQIAVRSGTIAARSAHIEQIPSEWLALGTAEKLCTGDAVRVVNARQSTVDRDPAIISVDRASTAVWSIKSAATDQCAKSD